MDNTLLLDKIIVGARNMMRRQEVQSKLTAHQQKAELITYQGHCSRFNDLLQEYLAENLSELMEDKFNTLVAKSVDKIMGQMEDKIQDRIIDTLEGEVFIKKVRAIVSDDTDIVIPPVASETMVIEGILDVDPDPTPVKKVIPTVKKTVKKTTKKK